MQITEVRVNRTFNEGVLRGIASVTLDNQFVIHSIKVIRTRDRDLVAMPSRKMKDGTHRDVAHPINSEFREKLEQSVMLAYREALARAEPD